MESPVKNLLLAGLLCPLVGSLALAQPPAFRAAGTPGGYNAVPVDDPMVMDAKAFVQKHFPAMDLGGVTEAWIQVVEGYNVKFVCQVKDGGGTALWQFVAFESTEGAWCFVSACRI